MLDQLPVLGLGVSLSLGEKPSPLSLYQQADNANRPQFIEYAGLCDVNIVLEQLTPLLAEKIPLLFHPSFINFCGSFKNNSQWLDVADQHIKTVKSPWFAQDCAYCFFSQQQNYSSQLAYFIPPILNAASLAQAVERVKEVKQHIDTPVLIEPPPVTFVVGRMPVFEFFGQLAVQADCGLLLDMGHLVSYEMATGKKVMTDIHQLPLERVIELHIAGGKLMRGDESSVAPVIDDPMAQNVNKPIYIDAHENSVLDEVWAMFELMLPRLPNVKAVCFECEGIEETEVFEVLARIKALIITYSASPELVQYLSIRRSSAS